MKSWELRTKEVEILCCWCLCVTLNCEVYTSYITLFLFSDQADSLPPSQEIVVLMCTEGSLQFNIIYVPCSVMILQCLFQQLQNSSIDSHNKPLTCFGIFRALSGRYLTKKRKTQHRLIMTWICNCRVKKDVTAYEN